MLNVSSAIVRAAFFVSLCVLQNSEAASKDAHPTPLGKLVDVGDGRRVHLYCTGEGDPTVVVISGGFSFDWGLIQPQIARLTRICTYDPGGTAWSDPLPSGTKPSCAVRVNELHELLNQAGVTGPYVLVGFSIGGLVARLYESQNPDKTVGMVIVDHAFVDTQSTSAPAAQPPVHTNGVDTPPVLISATPIVLDLEDDRNFTKLSEQDQELHRWALSTHSFRPTPEMAEECFSEVENATRGRSFPLGNRPLIVVSTLNDSPSYRELQGQLLLLSRNSGQAIATNSTHMVIIDQPEVVVRAIETVVTAARDPRTSLKR